MRDPEESGRISYPSGFKLCVLRAETFTEVLSREADTNGSELQAARLRVAELEAELGRVSGRDALISSLMTLPAFRAQLELELERAQRYGRPLTVAILDIDRFRYLNMKRGYATGDKILHAVGELLADRTRALDLTCRAGADEFVMLLSESPVGEAQIVLERILVALEGVGAGDQKGVSASVGIAGLRHGQSADSLLAQAAMALDGARTEGGGRVLISDGSEGEPGQIAPTVGTNVEVVAALAQALEERDQYTGEHSESVVDLTERVAQALGMDEEDIKDVLAAALLHDIGKVGIPDEVLHKNGPLDAREWEIMHQHPVIGERIMRAIPGMGSIARVVRHEHERWDGGGYPDGLAGEAIPLSARIILACDAYHAMVSDRPYRKAMSHHDAMAELTANAGTQFDPEIVQALVGCLVGRRQAGLEAV
ncbi:MAG: diguanylate cyclase [Actinomycetota bacterium]|nr:diguanylate cyclase [Actinomycetota bacterium]